MLNGSLAFSLRSHLRMCARYNLRSSPQALAEYFETAPLEPPVTLPAPQLQRRANPAGAGGG